MSFLDKIKNIINVPDDDYYDDEDNDFEMDEPLRVAPPITGDSASASYSSGKRPRSERTINRRSQDDPNKVVNIHTTAQLQVVLVKPNKFEDAAEIADNLNEKRTVVLNLEYAQRDVARRLVDFLNGVAYANNGKIKRVANSTFIITPYNVDVMGDLLDELENNGMFF